jgi:hypothetical protein
VGPAFGPVLIAGPYDQVRNYGTIPFCIRFLVSSPQYHRSVSIWIPERQSFPAHTPLLYETSQPNTRGSVMVVVVRDTLHEINGKYRMLGWKEYLVQSPQNLLRVFYNAGWSFAACCDASNLTIY